jgi:hypothetical protein
VQGLGQDALEGRVIAVVLEDGAACDGAAEDMVDEAALGDSQVSGYVDKITDCSIAVKERPRNGDTGQEPIRTAKAPEPFSCADPFSAPGRERIRATEAPDLFSAPLIDVSAAKITSGTTDLANITFGTETTVSLTAPATIETKTSAAIMAANLGSPSAGDLVVIRVRRLPTNSSDTHPGQILLNYISVQDT